MRKKTPIHVWVWRICFELPVRLIYSAVALVGLYGMAKAFWRVFH